MNNARRIATLWGRGIRLPFLDNFDRANSPESGQWYGPTWTIASNVALNTPASGNTLVTNGDFAGWTGGNPNSWGLLDTEDGSNYVEESPAGQAHIVNDATGVMGIWQAAGITAEDWFLITCDITRTSGNPVIRIGGSNVDHWYGATVSEVITHRGRATDDGKIYFWTGQNNAGNYSLDNVVVKKLTSSSLFILLPPCGVANVTAQVIVSAFPKNTQAGLVINADNRSDPQNCVLAIIDRVAGASAQAKLIKRVAGVYTELTSGNITYQNDRILRVVKSGSTYSLWYDDAQVGTNQTITGMNGTIHGRFSTYSGNTFNNYSLTPT